MFLLHEKDLKSLISMWSRSSEVFTPQMEEGQVMLLPFEESSFTMDYINFAFPVKEYFFKQREIVFNWRRDKERIELETPVNYEASRRIYFGVRPCDVYGIKYMDKFFLEGYNDNFYEKHRKASIIAAVNCSEAGENCFCPSMGTGPFAKDGFDLLFTPLKDRYLVEAGSDKGRELIEASRQFLIEAVEEVLEEKNEVLTKVREKFITKVNRDNIGKVLEQCFENPLWDKLSRDCISCVGCTSVCPTCSCFNVVEESRGSERGSRVRYWDSCQSDSFTRNAGGHNPRSCAARVRYRIYDKFKYIEDKFNMKGCTGCGRCIGVCPAYINVVDIINQLTEGLLNIEAQGGE